MQQYLAILLQSLEKSRKLTKTHEKPIETSLNTKRGFFIVNICGQVTQ